MKDEFPKKPWKNECGIFNLQNSDQHGSHWVSYKKINDDVYYFDSYGNAEPTKEFIKYMKNFRIFYNSEQIQHYNDPPFCGHACLFFIKYNYNFIPNKWIKFMKSIRTVLSTVNQNHLILYQN